MINRGITCDVCKKKRGPSNHWFELRRTITGAPYFLEWTGESEDPGTGHICGEACAHVVLSRHLAALREKVRVAA